MTSVRTGFEQVFYPSFPRPACAPDRLAAIAILFGLSVAEVETARVLEIGCSDGGNIVPLAVATPRGKFLGIDFADSAVARGQEQIRALQLTNIELRLIDLTTFPVDQGLFDYIIVHGVFSWVSPAVQSAILALIQRHLAPTGLAYIDYNAQPGSQLRYAFRDSMLYHVQRFDEPRQRIDQARSLIKLIIDANPQPSLYRTMAEAELQALLQKSDATMFHDTIAEYNQPFFFHQFMTAAAKHGLQYVAEAELAHMNHAHLPAPVQERLAGLRNLIDREQYLDILANRGFRQTVLCHAGRAIKRALDGSTLMSLYFTAASIPVRDTDETLVFRSSSGEVTIVNPAARAIMKALLAVAPARLSADELIAALQTGPVRSAEALEKELRAILLHAVMFGIMRPYARPAPFEITVAEKPMASPLARYQAARGTSVATLDHAPMETADELSRRLLPLCDGQHTVEEIAGALGIQEDVVREYLQTIARSALLLRRPIADDSRPQRDV